MILNYKKSESTVKPELIDSTSSKKFIYLRQNIIKKVRVDNETNENITYYEYEEAKLNLEEYNQYLKELSIIDIQKQRADIDYIALMCGIDLEEQ